MTGIQIVAGPKVDERGGVGGIVRLRGAFGVGDHVIFAVAPTAEAGGFQVPPQGAFGLGLGAMLRIDLDPIILTAGARALVAISPVRSFVAAAGGWFAVIPKLRHWGGGSISVPDHTIGLGFELAADYTFASATRSLLLSPGLVFHRERVGGG